MPDFIFDIVSPVNPKWHNQLNEQNYIKLRDILGSIADDFRTASLLDWDETAQILPLRCAIKFTDDDEIKTLNRDFRGKNKATNVLSFPDGDIDRDDDGNDFIYLGDIILAYETIQHESTEQAKDVKDHLTHLCVHGILHLLGHNHIDKEEAEVMESLEIKLLQKCGIKNPYDV